MIPLLSFSSSFILSFFLATPKQSPLLPLNNDIPLGMMLSARVATSVCSAARARVPKSTSAAAYSVARHTALPAAAAGCREFTNSSSLPTFYNDTQAKPSSSFVRRAKHPWRPVTHCSAFVPDGLADNQYEELEKAVDRHLNKILDDNAHDKKVGFRERFLP